MRVHRTTPPSERFWAKVAKGDGPLACWLWTGAKRRKGYGSFWLSDGQNVGAHIYAYEESFGPVPAGLDVMHSCDTPSCVRNDGPNSHVSAGTEAANQDDKWAKGRGNPPAGERARTAKLTGPQVLEIRGRYTGAHGELAALAREYGVTYAMVRDLIIRRTWKHI